MSIFSDYKCGALSEEEFRAECNSLNIRARAEERDLAYEEGYVFEEQKETAKCGEWITDRDPYETGEYLIAWLPKNCPSRHTCSYEIAEYEVKVDEWSGISQAEHYDGFTVYGWMPLPDPLTIKESNVGHKSLFLKGINKINTNEQQQI